MSALAVAVAELADALEAESLAMPTEADPLTTVLLPAYGYVPEAIEPPCLVIQPAEPYLDGSPESGTTFAGEYALNVEVYLLVQLGSNEQAAADLDVLLEHVLGALPESWGLKAIGRPGPFHTAAWLAHGVPVTLSRFITL